MHVIFGEKKQLLNSIRDPHFLCVYTGKKSLIDIEKKVLSSENSNCAP